MKYFIVNDVRLVIEIETDDPNRAVRIARDSPLDEWQVGDKDEIEVYDEDDNTVDFDWTTVEALGPTPETT
jgi:hypothetical protein